MKTESLFYFLVFHTDFLLCHDDKVEDRQIAFIYYLVPEDWTQDDGGRLDLFNNQGK